VPSAANLLAAATAAKHLTAHKLSNGAYKSAKIARKSVRKTTAFVVKNAPNAAERVPNAAKDAAPAKLSSPCSEAKG
jgi:hypothetical protein